MNEMAYAQHIKEAEKMADLARTLRSLYGIDTPKERVLLRARLDGLITPDEVCKLKEFCAL